MNAYIKTVFRTIKDNIGRFIAVTMIILLGVSFISGLGTLAYKMNRSLANAYREANSPDVMIKCTSAQGIDANTQTLIADMGGGLEVQLYTMFDEKVGEEKVRTCITELQNQRVNKLALLEGRYPENADEVVVERASDAVDARKIGSKLTVLGAEKTVVGIVGNPTYTYRGGEPMMTEDAEKSDDLKDQEMLDLIVYLDGEYFANLYAYGLLPVTDLFVAFEKSEEEIYFSEEYDTAAKACADVLAEKLQDDTLVFLTLKDTTGYALAQSYEDKVNVIAAIFPVFFIAVSALVVLTTMTRMIEEERSAIGCYRTLGYGDGKIAFKYLFFSLACCIVGAGLGIAIGLTFLPSVIYPAFNTMFFVPPWKGWVSPTMGIVAAVAMLFAVCAVTLYLIKRELRGQPAEILRPKTPKAGKKIFLEKIPFLWNKLPFRLKSTFRNIFRYGKHLLMTVISVAGSTALVLAGLGLSDVCRSDSVRIDFPNMADSVAMISVVIIVFAALLSVLVVYNLTNMNIGERKREIATLKVLGYRNIEVYGYVFREVVIMAIMGIIVGIPLGYGLLRFAFSYLDFGAVADVKWYSYLLAGVFILLSVGIVDLLLSKKIKKIDMTTSLKTVE